MTIKPTTLKKVNTSHVLSCNVTNMENMFYLSTSFNQDIGIWNVSNVETMFAMFNGATSFNQPLDNWDVSNVTNMSYAFYGCGKFNSNIFLQIAYDSSYFLKHDTKLFFLLLVNI